MHAANPISDAVDRFQQERSAARRFHAATIGRDVDPEYCMGDFLVLVRKDDRATLEKRYGSTVRKNTGAMAETAGGTVGGYTVPQELAIGLMRDVSMGCLMRQYGAYVCPMKTLTLDLPLPDMTTVQAAGVAPYFGGIQLKWTAENKKFDETAEPQFRTVRLTAWELEGYAVASNPFVQDALGLDQWLTRLFGWSVAWYQNQGFFSGSGVGQPQGVIGCAAASEVNRGTPGTIVVADAQSMFNALLPSSAARAVWFAHPSTTAKITAFTGWIPNGDFKLFGRPIINTGQCSTLGTKGDLILVDPAFYVIGDRMQIEIAYSRDEPTAFLNNQSVFRVFSRVDGQPALNAPITMPDSTTKQSPLVVLN